MWPLPGHTMKYSAATACAIAPVTVAEEYPHSTLKGSPTYSSHRVTGSGSGCIVDAVLKHVKSIIQSTLPMTCMETGKNNLTS